VVPVPPFALALAGLLASVAEPGGLAREESGLELQTGGAALVDQGTRGAAGDVAGAARFSLFVPGLEDDERPRALQPFLERTSAVELRVGGGYRAVPAGLALPGDLASTARRFVIDLAGRFYVARWLALIARTGYGLAATVGDLSQAIPFGGGVAFRLGDFELQLTAEARYAEEQGAGALSARGALDLRLVALEHIDLAAGAAVGRDEHAGYFRVGWYPSRALGLLWAVFGGRLSAPRPPELAAAGGLTESPLALPGFDHIGAQVGVSYWPSPGFGCALLYSAAWFAGNGQGATDQRAGLSVATRWR
jgi:hypothetical protein